MGWISLNACLLKAQICGAQKVEKMEMKKSTVRLEPGGLDNHCKESESKAANNIIALNLSRSGTKSRL